MEPVPSIGIVYLHLVDHSAMGAPPVPADFKKKLRDAFARTFIAVGGFDAISAEKVLQAKEADLIAFKDFYCTSANQVPSAMRHSAL